MKTPHILILCLITGTVSSIDVGGFVGGNVKIKCEYESIYSRHNKYFCKGQSPGCKDKVKTSAQNPSDERGRFSLCDNGRGHFTVQIANLTLQDTGMYQCAVDIPQFSDVYTSINLVVTDVSTDLRKTCKEPGVTCTLNFLKDMERYGTASLPVMDVSGLLDVLLEAPPDSLALQGEEVLQASEKLVARLVQPTHTESFKNSSTSIKFTTNTTEVEMLSVGPATSMTNVHPLVTTNVSLDINLPGMAQNNNGTASVVLVVYKSMQEVLNATFFNTGPGYSTPTMSNAISVVVPHIQNKTLPSPVNLTIKLRRTQPKEKPVCVYWNVSAWIMDGCHVRKTNSTDTVCSCEHLSTFALIMTINHNLEKHPVVDILNTIFVLIGLVFLTLAVMTFALCRWNPRVSNMARLNLCVCLLLAHPLFLLTQSFLHLIWPNEVLCKVLSGVLQFLFLCSFVWMFMEAVLLFLSVRKLRQVKPNERLGLHWKLNLLIGYGIPLIIVAVSAGVRPEGYGSDKCWLKEDDELIWSFVGPVCFILVGNIILFLTILITIHSTLKKAHSDVSKVKYNRVLLFKIMAQFIILGCAWILGLLAAHSRVLEVLFLFLTSQQGTAIFLIHCFLNTEVRKQYRMWWQRYGPSGADSASCSGTVSVNLPQQSSGATQSTSHTITTLSVTPLVDRRDSGVKIH